MVVVAMAAAAERVVMAAETLLVSQISAAATTIFTATAWTPWLTYWKVYIRLILSHIILNLVRYWYICVFADR